LARFPSPLFHFVKVKPTLFSAASCGPRLCSQQEDSTFPEICAGQARWQSARTLLVAPFYGADASGTRGGWPAPFVDRIRRAEYPQYIWDQLPSPGGPIDSIFR